MKPGQSSKTAALVCMGRAIANEKTSVPRFHDPTARTLLDDDARARVERFLSGEPPKTARAKIEHGYLAKQSVVMALRTVAIDDAVREAALPQVVILGAGLDGRAWRMPELGESIVFEVDHPDTQVFKRGRVAALTQTAREVRFVPVDFLRDDLGEALARAGHDPAKPTTWIWEGVVMYLDLPAIEATLAVIASRSAKQSRLIVLYHSPSWILWWLGMFVRRLGEPLKSSFKAEKMRSLLAKFGFTVARDENLPELASRLAPEVTGAVRPIKHMRVVIADRT
jgi:methyltransferase (TIGR00027 family)